MTTTEVIVIVCGLALGYWMVSNWLSGKNKSAAQYKQNATEESNNSREQQSPPNSNSARHELHWSIVLGVSPSATTSEIRSAYKSQMNQYHPDKVAALGVELRELAEIKSKEINSAYSRATSERDARR